MVGQPRLGIVIGSTRPGRKGAQVGAWVAAQAQTRGTATYDVLDLADFELALLDDPLVPGEAKGVYASPQTRRWSEAVSGCEGFVWVTPEYNHGVPAAMKNALDVLYPEWLEKTVAFVSYGWDGGLRVVEQWRGIVANVRMHAVRNQVPLSLVRDFADGEFAPGARAPAELARALDDLERLTVVTRPLRQT
jgi:NAD(P)H-dependent FMN reductase